MKQTLDIMHTNLFKYVFHSASDKVFDQVTDIYKALCQKWYHFRSTQFRLWSSEQSLHEVEVLQGHISHMYQQNLHPCC